ncbi:hypothetical protein BX616_011146 [Lobosporangium transversale]|nr:hypothetical protein BX616_011146 [Lobosporangium transversale]
MDLMSAPAVMVPRGISAQPSEDRESERAPSRLEGYLPSPLPRPLNHARPVITDKKPLMPSAKATVSITRAAVRKLDLSDTLKTKTPLSEPTMITVGPLSSAASPSHIAHKNLTPQLQDMTTNSTQAATQQTQTQLTAATSRQQQQQQQSGATAPSTPVRQRVEDKTSSSDLYKGKEELTRHPPQAILPKDHQQPVFTDVLTETVKYALLGANPTADSNGASLGLKKPAAASTTATVKAETTVVNVDSSTDSSGPNTAHLVLGPYLPPTPDFSSNIPSSDSDPNGNAGVVHPPARALMHAASSSSSPSSSPPLTAHKKVNNNNAHTPVKQVPSPEPTAIARAPSPVPKTVHTLDPLLRSEPTVADLSPLPIRPPRRKPSLLAHQSERQQQQQQQQQPQHRHQNYVQRKLFSPSELPSSETCKTPSPTLTPTPIPTATPIPFPLTSKSTSTPAMQQPSAPTAQFTTSAIAAFPLPPVLSSSRPSSPNGKEIVAEHYHKQGQEQHMRYQDQARNISPVPSITTTSSDQNSSMSVIPNNASSANTSFVSLRDDADIQAEAGAISPVMDHVSPVPTSVTSPTTPYSAKTLETTSSPSASIPEASPLPPLQYQSQHKPSSKELVLTAAWLQDPPAAGPGGRKKRAGDPQLGDFGTRLSQFNFDE